MERCTDERSLTPPLPANMIIASKHKENGKQIISSTYNKGDQNDNSRPIVMKSIAGLCNYNLTSDEDEEENTEKSTTQIESTKSSVINAKCRASEEKSRKRNERHRRESRDSSSRRKSWDRKHRRRSFSKNHSEDNNSGRNRSRSKERKRFHELKSTPKESPPTNREIRRTVTEPVIEYCENGRYPSLFVKRDNVEAKPMMTIEPQKTLPDRKKRIKEECLTPKREPDEMAAERKSVESERLTPCIKDDSAEIPVNIKQSPKEQPQQQENATNCSGKSPAKLSKTPSPKHFQHHGQYSDSVLDIVKSTTPERPKPVKKSHTKTETDSKSLTQDKLMQYIEEYESFMQQVSSSPKEPPPSPPPPLPPPPPPQQPASPPPIATVVAATVSVVARRPASSTSTSTSSSSSSSDSYSSDSSSSSSSSNSDDDSSSSSDSTSSSTSDQKSRSESSTSRSASKTPPIPSLTSIKPGNSFDGMDFMVGNVEKYCSQSSSMLLNTSLASLSHGQISVNTLKKLDDLINFDDDDDLLRNLESYKNHMREIKMAKEAAEKSKLDGTSAINNRVENGGLIHETERKKISLKLKPTTPLKHQTNELNEAIADTEPKEMHRPSNEYNVPAVPATDDHTEKSSNEKRATAKKKSSYRKDERKPRRHSEDRKSRGSEERSSRSRRSHERSSKRGSEKRSKRSADEKRTKRSEDRHSRRSEERRSRRSEEKRSQRNEERRPKRRHERSPPNSVHYRDSYYSPQYRNRSMSPIPRGPRTPPNTPPPNSATDFDEFGGSGSRGDDPMSMRHIPYSTTVMPPDAHYQPDPNQFGPGSLSSNAPNYMNEFAAYMHPRMQMPPQYNRPPPGITTSPGGHVLPPIGANQTNEFYFNNSPSHGVGPPPPHHLSNPSMPPNSYSNLIEVSHYGIPNSSNVDCIRKQQGDQRRKPTIAVQKGNVLEIVPSAEIQCSDKNAIDADKSEKVLLIEKQHQQALQRQRQERFKRKMDRHHKRLDRNKRKEFLLAELNRLSHLMIFGDDGKIIKAGEILKSIVYDGTTIKMANAKDTDYLNDEPEEIYVEPPIHTYDPQAAVGPSILFERNIDEKPSGKRRGVLFADGVAPGDGTSPSENSDNDDDDIVKPKKLSARMKNKKKQQQKQQQQQQQQQQQKDSSATTPPMHSNDSPPSSYLEKENALETKFNPRDANQQQVVPPPPPGSPPLHLPQPKLKDPNKFIVNQLLYFHYDARVNKMIITPTSQYGTAYDDGKKLPINYHRVF